VLYGDRQCGSSSVQEVVANIVLGRTLYSSSSILVPPGISEREETPQTDIMKAKMCQQVQTPSPQFFLLLESIPLLRHQNNYFRHSGDNVDNYSIC
jgi:hypothetical protein